MRNYTLALIAVAGAGLAGFGASHLSYGDSSDPAGNAPIVAIDTKSPHAVEPSTDALAEPAEPKCVLPAESYNGKTIAQWRAEGPEGLAELIGQLQPTIDAYRQAKTPNDFPIQTEKPAITDEALSNLLLLDQVAQQRDAYAAGLYWHTDLDAAIEEAKRTGKPILSLRMLGQLVDEYSCANSRFFRTVLYADESVSKLLREQFVLHWQSVRPVPVITVDMGDGRTIKRTITGNSAHYVLDSNGRVVDCLPGLYGPDTFERFIKIDYDFAIALADKDDNVFASSVAIQHQQQAGELDRAWSRYMAVIKEQDGLNPAENPQQAAVNLRKDKPAMPNAIEAGRIAIGGKYIAERPLVNAVVNAPSAKESADDMDMWKRIAQAYAGESVLDENSRALMASKAPRESVDEAMRRALSKTRVESPLVRMVRNFQGGIAIETARNEHLLRRQLHDWFATAQSPMDLDALNKRVYAELFLTPDEDPWLGLVPADTYSALDAGGLLK